MGFKVGEVLQSDIHGTCTVIARHKSQYWLAFGDNCYTQSAYIVDKDFQLKPIQLQVGHKYKNDYATFTVLALYKDLNGEEWFIAQQEGICPETYRTKAANVNKSLREIS